MDIKAIVEKIVSALKKDSSLLDKFKIDPKSIITKFVSEKLTNNQITDITKQVSTEMGIDTVKKKASGILGNLFK